MPRQNGRHCADKNLNCILFNEKVWISSKISQMFVCRSPIDNIPALVQVMASRRTDKQAIIWASGGLVYWGIFVSLGLNAWTHWDRQNNTTFSRGHGKFKCLFFWKQFIFLMQISVFPLMVRITMIQFSRWLRAKQMASHYLNQWWQIYCKVGCNFGRYQMLAN